MCHANSLPIGGRCLSGVQQIGSGALQVNLALYSHDSKIFVCRQGSYGNYAFYANVNQPLHPSERFLSAHNGTQ